MSLAPLMPAHAPITLLLAAPLVTAAAEAARPGDIPGIMLASAFPRLTFDRPVCLAAPDDGSGRLFVVEQAGTIRSFKASPDVARATTFLDLSAKVRTSHNEEGLLALAFHPDFKKSGTFYVFYSLLPRRKLADRLSSKPRENVLSRFKVKPGSPDQADPSSEEVLLRVEKKWGNHNGATLLFGPDGFLYVSLGDGGAGGDPDGNGQSLGTLLGKILRIDVDRADHPLPYAIPKDNPFVGKSGARPEIWAYGLRNVWRMSFDRKTGELWAGDVGQEKREEIDIVTKGGNYGWSVREGTIPFKDIPANGTLVPPLTDYGRDQGACVTGGYVYRGQRFPRLQGVYIYADYVTGTLFGLRAEGGKLAESRVILEQPRNIASFGEDPEGELYALAFDGRIYRIEEKGAR